MRAQAVRRPEQIPNLLTPARAIAAVSGCAAVLGLLAAPHWSAWLGGTVLGLLVAVEPATGWVRLCGLPAAFGAFFLVVELV